MPSWIQHPETGKLIPRDEYVPPSRKTSAFIQGDIESFVSPIDGTVIDDRAKLRRHNARHGVTDSRDYGKDYYNRKKVEREQALACNTEKARSERVADLIRAFEQSS